MSNDLNFYINGEWVKSESNELIDVINPANEEVIGQVTAGTKDDIDMAVNAASEAFKSFSKTSQNERIELLKNIIKEYENRYQDFVEIITKEMGAPNWLSERAQANTGLINFKETLEALEEYKFEKEEGGYTLRKEPIGVIGMITPWNWPMNQITTKVSAAIATGCTMVLKPSEISPYCSMLLAEVMHDAGVPKGVFNLVNGYGPIVGAALSEHEKVDMMSFTGSTRAGIAVAQASATTVKRVQQELGGKSANIILDDADLSAAIPSAVGACFLNSGQTCSALTRLLVPSSKMDEAAELAAQAAAGFTVGPADDETSKLGPLVSQAQWDRVQNYIKTGIDEGAAMVTGGLGKPDGLDSGYFVKPTVFANVENSMTIAQEEIFGPVLSIIGYEDDEDAIRIANDSDYGLSGGVWSSDNERALKVAKKLRTGEVDMNGSFLNTDAPFGGYKKSGNGRELGRFGMYEFVEAKQINLPL